VLFYFWSPCSIFERKNISIYIQLTQELFDNIAKDMQILTEDWDLFTIFQRLKMNARQKIRKSIILISFLLFPVTMYYFSPAIIIFGASRGMIVGGFISFSIMFISSLLFGRLFCGWLCPGAGIEEAFFIVNDKPVKRNNWIKYLIWVPWLSAIIILFLRNGINAVDPLFGIRYGISMSEPRNYITFYFFLALFVVLSLAVGKRSFCHHVCWMAPFMIAGRRVRNIFYWPSLHLKAIPADCKKCHLCTRHCPMSLDVERMVLEDGMENDECILCGSCADQCGNGAIRYGFWSQSRNRTKISRDN
jgi:ferredoxin-type protein NapH